MRKLLFVCCLLVFVGGLQTIRAQGTSAFTYQGQLELATGPATGTYQMVFRLYDAPSAGGLRAGPLTNVVAVSNGVFTTQLDFGPIFGLPAYWLEIGVRTNGSVAAHTILTPRQRLTPVPHAIYAMTAGDLRQGASPTFTGTVTFNPFSGPPFNVGSNTKVPNLNADWLDGLDSTAFVLKAGDTMSGNLNIANPATLNFGSSVRQMINLWGLDYGIGVQAGTLYFRSDGNFLTSGNFAWYRGGTHADGQFDPGDGEALMTLDHKGTLRVLGSSTTTMLNGATIAGLNVFPIGVNVTANGPNSTGVYASSDDSSGIAIRGRSLDGYAGTFDGAVRIDGDSSHNKPFLQLHETQDGDYARIQLQVANRPLWHVSVGGIDNSLVFYNSAHSIVTSVSETGVLTTKVLTITGGADIAEPFKMSEANLPKGAVVVIDEENPSHLKLSTQAYDTRVAGVISGAGGVTPGLSLSQQGVVEGDQHVALTGRVYVQADASNGAIKPGDLLTSSHTPGHAMKVADHARAQGAILGKAMTGLKTGNGLVLVLVTLQ